MAMTDAGVQTGSIPGAGKTIGSGGGKRVDQNILGRILQRIRTSMPILKAVKVDDDLWRLILAELVNERVLAGQQVVVPESIIV